MAFKIFLSKTPKMAFSDFDSTQVSEPYTSTGLIKVLYNFILFFMDKNYISQIDTKSETVYEIH
jgi:hypothetical protein